MPADDISDLAVQFIQHEMDSTIVLSRKVAEQGVRPAVDLTLTQSSLLTPEIVGERHCLLSVQAGYYRPRSGESLKGISYYWWKRTFPADRADYAKSALLPIFSQNMNVATKAPMLPGDYFTREETLSMARSSFRYSRPDENHADESQVKPTEEKSRIPDAGADFASSCFGHWEGPHEHTSGEGMYVKV